MLCIQVARLGVDHHAVSWDMDHLLDFRPAGLDITAVQESANNNVLCYCWRFLGHQRQRCRQRQYYE